MAHSTALSEAGWRASQRPNLLSGSSEGGKDGPVYSFPPSNFSAQAQTPNKHNPKKQKELQKAAGGHLRRWVDEVAVPLNLLFCQQEEGRGFQRGKERERMEYFITSNMFLN